MDPARALAPLIAALLLAAALAPPAAAQEATGAGTVRLADWPGEAPQDAPELLPSLDTLTLRYRYAAGQEAPRMTFALEWKPGETGWFDGQEVPYAELPDGLRMTGLELRAEVYSGGRAVAEALIAVDSMRLGPFPDLYRFEGAGLSYATVFAETPADSARAYFAKGFTLRDPEILSVSFAEEEPSAQEAARRPPRRPRARRQTVYVPRPAIDVIIGWRIGPDPYRVGRGGRRSGEPRGEAVGRTAEERTARTTGRGGRTASPGEDGRTGRRTADDNSGTAEAGGETAETDGGARTGRGAEAASGGRSSNGKRGEKKGRKDDDDDDSDDDDESLVPAAVVAAAAVGVLAVGGGTVGYYGTTETPLGLSAGWVRPQGGALLHASVNPELLDSSAEDPHRLTVKAVGFLGVGRLPVQPALGLGAQAVGRDEVEIEPALSLGAAGNFGRVVLLGGYDVLRGAAEFGLVVNFRHRPER